MHNFFRHIALAYLMLLMLLKVLSVPAIALHYYLNKDDITARYCENKARPAMKCNGKCHLRKQLARASESADPTDQKVSNSSSVVDFCEPLEPLEFRYTFSPVKEFHISPAAVSRPGHTGNIFHPPIA